LLLKTATYKPLASLVRLLLNRRAAHFANYAAEEDDTAPTSGKEV